jgi:hypothetical protein
VRNGAGNSSRSRIPYRLIVGLVLAGSFWALSWLRIQPVSDYYFFPLWLGYILTVDGILELRTGTSPWKRNPGIFVALFLISSPFWWIFEGLNLSLQNWDYHFDGEIGTLQFAIASSFAFSTVIPAVICTSELIASFRLGERVPGLGHWRFGAGGLFRFQVAGVAMLIVIALWPTYTFPLVWLALFFIVEPLNQRFGQGSLWQSVRSNNWTPVYNVMIGTALTGFFWEMWNIYAMPKWTYNVPFVDFLRVFEMPILGYFGYMPFGLEVVSFTAFVLWIFGRSTVDVFWFDGPGTSRIDDSGN